MRPCGHNMLRTAVGTQGGALSLRITIFTVCLAWARNSAACYDVVGEMKPIDGPRPSHKCRYIYATGRTLRSNDLLLSLPLTHPHRRCGVAVTLHSRKMRPSPGCVYATTFSAPRLDPLRQRRVSMPGGKRWCLRQQAAARMGNADPEATPSATTAAICPPPTPTPNRATDAGR